MADHFTCYSAFDAILEKDRSRAIQTLKAANKSNHLAKMNLQLLEYGYKPAVNISINEKIDNINILNFFSGLKSDYKEIIIKNLKLQWREFTNSTVYRCEMQAYGKKESSLIQLTNSANFSYLTGINKDSTIENLVNEYGQPSGSLRSSELLILSYKNPRLLCFINKGSIVAISLYL